MSVTVYATPLDLASICLHSWMPVSTLVYRLWYCRKHKRRDEVTDQHISLLLNCGLLTRHLTQKDTYWFALAGIGPLIKSLVKGRKV